MSTLHENSHVKDVGTILTIVCRIRMSQKLFADFVKCSDDRSAEWIICNALRKVRRIHSCRGSEQMNLIPKRYGMNNRCCNRESLECGWRRPQPAWPALGTWWAVRPGPCAHTGWLCWVGSAPHPCLERAYRASLASMSSINFPPHCSLHACTCITPHEKDQLVLGKTTLLWKRDAELTLNLHCQG